MNNQPSTIVAETPGTLKVAIINARQVGHVGPISIHRYELRVYGGHLGESYLIRRRNDGTNPVTLADTTSGTGAPQWMVRAAERIRAARIAAIDPNAVEIASSLVAEVA